LWDGIANGNVPASHIIVVVTYWNAFCEHVNVQDDRNLIVGKDLRFGVTIARHVALLRYAIDRSAVRSDEAHVNF
jgi:hypothetical protein